MIQKEYFSIGKQIKRILKQQREHEERVLRRKDRSAFLKNPFAFGKKLFQPPKTLSPSFSASTCFDFFQQTYSDPQRSTSYESCPTAGPPPDCKDPVHDGRPTWSAFKDALKRCRNKSSPGPDGIPYVVWKFCTSTHPILFNIFQRVWLGTSIPSHWQVACVTLLPKSDVSDDPAKFRPIALANTMGKVFFSLLSHRLQKHMQQNNFFDGQIQKGFMPGVSGCLEHSTLCYEAMRDAKSAKRQICVAWIDLKNAFGSVRHNLIQYALRHYSVPLHLQQLVFSYYSGLSAFVSKPLTPSFRYDIGVFQGCPLSPVLFNVCFQLLLDSLATPALQPLAYEFKSVVLRVAQTAFADDLGLLSKSSSGCQTLISVTGQFLDWTKCMKAAPHKCKCSAAKVIQKSYVTFDPALTMYGSKIDSIQSEEFKFLGRRLRADCSEGSQREDLRLLTRSLMSTVQGSRLEDHHKLWLYHHLVVPKLSWSFQVLELSLTFVRELHKICLPFLKKWSGLPRCANSAILFIGSRKRFGLRLHYLPTVWKKCQATKWHLLRSSRDPRMHALYSLRQAKDRKLTRRYAPTVELECAEASSSNSLQMPTHTGRAGLGSCPQRQFPKPPRKELLDTFRQIDVEAQTSHLRTLKIQGKWLGWSNEMWHDIRWQSLLYGGTGRDLKFLLASALDVLPTGANLRRWGNSVVDDSCVLCRRPSTTLRHILSACASSLKQGRYTWRHDNVLQVLAEHVSAAVRQKCSAADSRTTAVANIVPTAIHSETSAPGTAPVAHSNFISFQKAGSRPTPTNLRLPRRELVSADLLSSAADWELLVDSAERKISFPSCIAATTLRPDLVLYSRSSRIVFWMELTVCEEDRFGASNSRKTKRYEDLREQCVVNGWQVFPFSVEVSVRGVIPQSMRIALKTLGLSNNKIKLVCGLCSMVALRSSYVIWIRRREKNWSESPL